MMKRLLTHINNQIILLVLAIGLNTANAQIINVTLNRSLNLQITPTDLWGVTISSNVTPIDIELSLVISNKNNGTIYSAYSDKIILTQAITSLRFDNIKVIKSNFAQSQYGNYYKETGYLPSGTYEYCIQVIQSQNKEVLTDACDKIEAIQVTPLLLSLPDNGANIQQLTPVLSWIPVTLPNAQLKVYYEIKLCEIIGKQTRQDAIIRNRAMLAKSRITENFLLYANDMMPLVYGKKYAWQVIASDQFSNVLAKSEVWEFTPQVDTSNQTQINFFKSYIDLNANSTTSAYFIKQSIKIKYSEKQYPTDLSYTVIDEKGNIVLRSEAPLKVLAKENWFEILLNETNKLKNETKYTIQFNNGVKETFQIQFIYYK